MYMSSVFVVSLDPRHRVYATIWAGDGRSEVVYSWAGGNNRAGRDIATVVLEEDDARTVSIPNKALLLARLIIVGKDWQHLTVTRFHK